MQRAITILAAALGVQLVVAAALAWRGDRISTARPETPLINTELKDVDRIAIDGPVSPDKGQGGRVELVKRDGKWLLPGYFDAPADAAKVEDLLKRLAGSKRGLAVATTAPALARFRVADDDYEKRIVVGRGETTLATVYLGTSSGLRKTHARTAQDREVYAIELPAYEVRTAAVDWLDQALLKREAASLAAIEVGFAGKAALTLRRAERKEGEQTSVVWEAAGEHRVDAARAAALVEAIANVRVDAVLGTEPKPQWRQDRPELRLTLTDTQGKSVVWTISKADGGDTHVLKASDRPWYLELKSWNARPLLDAAAPEKLLASPGTKR
jgi:hypothetical protein